MRIGAIDCGTNSIRLLIADVERTDSGVQLTDATRVMRIVRLGEGVDANGVFSEGALERTFTAAREYAQILEQYPVQSLRFGATSATRDARNRDIFLDGIERILGVRPEVISGDEEAALSFAGALLALGGSEENTVVVDLGGGSTEFVLGNSADGVVAARSMNIGCVRLTERYAVDSPVSADQRESIIADVDAAIDGAADRVDFSSARALVGVAGTVTTLTAHALGLPSYDSERINRIYLTEAQTAASAIALVGMSREERENLGYMHPGRVDVIGTGVLIWSRIVERLQELSDGAIAGATTSEHDILDGLVLSQYSAGE